MPYGYEEEQFYAEEHRAWLERQWELWCEEEYWQQQMEEQQAEKDKYPLFFLKEGIV
jgi:hypothetical protein